MRVLIVAAILIGGLAFAVVAAGKMNPNPFPWSSADEQRFVSEGCGTGDTSLCWCEVLVYEKYMSGAEYFAEADAHNVNGDAAAAAVTKCDMPVLKQAGFK
jgi:hypothetical protein